MIHYHRTVHLGHDLALFLPDPNWRWALEIEHRLETRVEEGQTGRQNRRPRYSALRHTLSARWSLPREQTAEMQQALSELGLPVAGDRVYVGVPIFVDKLEPERWGERIYDAQWVVEYDESGYTIHAADALPATPARAWFAPLLVGRLDKRPLLKALNQDESQFGLKLLERSPWDFRIAPAPEGVVGPDWPEALAANWRELPEDWTEDILVYEDVGDGRVEALDGQDGNMHRAQQMLVTCGNRAEIRTLLNFFAARKGRVQAFTAPWCLQPGDDTGATPHSTRATFGEDRLLLKYTSDAEAEARIPMRQVPWEMTAVGGEQPEQAPDAYFYRFWIETPGSLVEWRFTSWEHDLQRVENGVPVSYLGDTAALIEHDRITQTIDLSDEPTTLGSWLFAGNPLLRVVQRDLDLPLHVEILRGTPDEPQAATVVYTGEVLEAEMEGRKITAGTAVLGGLLEVKVPNFYFGPTCQYQFAGAGCGLAAEAWTFGAEIVSVDANEVTVRITSNPPDATLGVDWFAKGWLKKGVGAAHEIRQIVRSADLGESLQRLTLKRPLKAFLADEPVTLRPYCSGTRSECEQKFSNYPNFGGHPHIGARNLSVPARELDSPTAKK